MENTQKFISNAFEKLVKNEMQQVFSKKDAQISLEKYNKIELDNSLLLKDILDAYKTDEYLSKLTQSIILINAAYLIFESNNSNVIILKDELNIIKENIENSENKKLWVLLWTMLQKKIIKNKTYSDEETAQFYIEFFKNDYVLTIEEFITDISLLSSSLFVKDKYLYILEDATKRYPEIIYLTRFIKFIYLATKNSNK